MPDHRALALFFMRTLLGLIVLMQGYGKVFHMGVDTILASMLRSFENLLPEFVLVFTAYFTSYVELVAGLLACLGLFRTWAYVGLVAVLLIVSFGHGLEKPIWNLEHVMYRGLLLVGILLCPKTWDRWHLDGWLARYRPSSTPSATGST